MRRTLVAAALAALSLAAPARVTLTK